MATIRRRGMGRGARRPGLERLEGRALLNASIDIAADGSLIYRTDPGAVESLLVSRAGGVYTFAVDPANNPIDVASNAAGLAVTGSGGRTVTVTGPSSLRIEARADGQTIRVRSTGVATQVILQADSERVILGDDQAAGSGGVQALAGPITVSAAEGSETNSLLVADGPAAYDAGSRPTYVVSAGAITSSDPTVGSRFAGIAYSGVSTLTLRGTTDTSAPTPLYVIQDTADGVATTIDAAAGPATRDFSITGTSSVATSKLTLISSGTANVWAASIDSPVTYIGMGGRASIYLESVRGGNYGIDSDFVVINGSGGGVDLAVGNFWNLGAPRGTPNWFLGFIPGSTEYASLRDADNPAVGGLFFRPGEVHSLGVDARGNRAASLMVDLRNGDPLPSASANGRPGEPAGGFTYVGARANHPGSPYALSLVGSPASGPFASAVHQAFPFYRGQIALAAGAETRNIAYQLSAGAPVLDDSSNVTDYRWFYDIMHGSVDGVRTRPDGTTETAILPSDLGVTAGGASVGGGQALSVVERTANVALARYLFAGKGTLRLQRGWSYGSVTTTVDYRPTPVLDPEGRPEVPPVAGLTGLHITDESPANLPTNDVVRLQALPPGASTYVDQGYGDDAGVVSLDGAVGATLVSFTGGANTPPTPNPPGGGDVLYIDAGGRRIEASTFQVVSPGVLRIPAASPDDAPLTLGGYERAQVFNSSATTFSIQPTSIPASARVPLVDVTAGVLTPSIAGFSPAGLTAVIAWGDGTGSAGRIEAVPGAPGSYRVVGTHAYTTSGVYTPRIILSGAGTATSTVSGVEIAFQVSGTSGTAAPAPGLAGRLAAESDSGASNSDALTNIVRPTFRGTSALPGAWIAVYATPAGGTGPQIYLGAATADASGAWVVVSLATLADGAYTIQATSASTSTWANGLATLAEPLVIDTVGPRVWGVDIAALRGEVTAVIRDSGGQGDSGVGLDLPRARDLATYAFGPERAAGAPPTSVRIAPGSTNGSQVVTLVTSSPRFRNGGYVLTIRSSAGSPTAGIRDLAGNPLDGAYAGSFPSGGANVGRDFRARLDLFNNRLRSIRPVG